MPLDDPGAPGQGQAGGHCVEVLAEGAGEALHGFRGVLFGLPDPFQQQVSPPVTDQIGEGSGEVAGARVMSGQASRTWRSRSSCLWERVSRGRMIQDVIMRGLGMSALTGSAVPARRAATCLRTTWRLPR